MDVGIRGLQRNLVVRPPDRTLILRAAQIGEDITEALVRSLARRRDRGDVLDDVQAVLGGGPEVRAEVAAVVVENWDLT